MKPVKKPFYKRWKFYAYTFVGIVLLGIILPDPPEDKPKAAAEKPEVVAPKKIEVAATSKEPEVAGEVEKSDNGEIDTSIFEYALETKVTDAIDLNGHVTVFVQMSEELKPGMATQHVVQQTYDFVQQDDVSGAKTITIAVKQGEIKIAQITVDAASFAPDDEEPMINLVIAASEIDFMTDEVKEYGDSMDMW